MTTRDDEVERFIEIRLESMLRRPEIWGSLETVEQLVLQLLELRAVLHDPSVRASANTQAIMERYGRFLANELGDNSAEPLPCRLARLDRKREFAALLHKFTRAERALLPRRPVTTRALEFPPQLTARGPS